MSDADEFRARKTAFEKCVRSPRGSRLQVVVDGQTVYDETLTAFKIQVIEGNPRGPK